MTLPSGKRLEISQMWLETLSSRLPFLKLDRIGISRRTSVEFSLILIANAVNNGTNFVANIIVARFFGHEVFGLFSVAVNIAFTTLTFSEFGMNLTMVRLYKLHEGDPRRANAVLLWNFCFKLAVVVLLSLLALTLSRPLSEWLTKRPDTSLLMAGALITGGILGLWSYIRAFFQSVDLIRKMAYVTFAFAALRLLFLAVFAGLLSMHDAQVLFLGIYLMPAALLVLFVFHGLIGRLRISKVGAGAMRDVSREIIHYSKWVAISGVSYVLTQKSMVFLVAAYADMKQVALLAAGLLFSGIFSLMNDSVRQILFPKVAQLDRGKIREYRQNLSRTVPAYFLLSLFVIAALSFFMYFSLGENYRASLPVFWITGAGMALVTGIGFYTIIIHTIRMPHIEAFVNVGRLLLVVVAGLLVVERYGVMGVALAFTVTVVAGELLVAVIVSRYVRRERHG